MRANKESVVAGEDSEHLIGTLGCTQLVTQTSSNARLNTVYTFIISMDSDMQTKYSHTHTHTHVRLGYFGNRIARPNAFSKTTHRKIQYVYFHYTNPKSRHIPSSACSGNSSQESPVPKGRVTIEYLLSAASHAALPSGVRSRQSTTLTFS